ncbi:MAG TPA: glycoside hydrolase family 3 C-terminal domain-containing protein [Solirubrobacteraceae bacterium]|nr:glycoside hydrolase family 3 C-terminal domain-containing protein [Solirubrobacteraceae bacterium]
MAAALLGVMLVPGSAAARGRHPKAPADSASCPWVSSHASIGQRVAQLMSNMTVADEDFLVEGHGTTNEGPNPSPNPYVFWMPGIASLCIPKLGEEDGPAGVADGLTGVTQLPAGVALAATWDPSLARAYGQVIGSEEAGKGADVNLGPTINIDRDPRWGRSFEAFTEDPFLNSALAVSEIDGVQSTGEMSQVKHYAVYNQETNRNSDNDDVIISKRTMAEIYLPAFQAAVEQAHSASVMCSYATINGDYACQNSFLENKTLRDQWDFPGFVTSDYGALHATAGALDGTDQEQPFNSYFGQPLLDAVNSNAIQRSVLDTMVQRILTEMFRFNLFQIQRPSTTSATVTSAAHQAVGNSVDDTGTVLLKNQNGTLPLSAHGGGSVAVIGPAASASPTYGGGGSAYVIPSATTTPLQGLQNAAGSGTTVSYTQGLPTDTQLTAIPSADLSPAYPAGGTTFGQNYSGTLTAPETGTYVLGITNQCGCYTPENVSLNGTTLIADPGTPPVSTYSVAVSLTQGQQYTLAINGGGETSHLSWATPTELAPDISAAVAAAQSAQTAVVVVSDDTESEATDRPGLNLPSAQDELIAAVAAANPHTVVVIDAGAPVAMPWLSSVASVVDAWYPGQSSGTSLADVLFGKVDPSGHLPVTFPTGLSQVPAASAEQFPGVNGQVLYSEGPDVGYRYYDATGETPLFPFGFGLSYTKFAFSRLRVQSSDLNGVSDVRVSATIRNTGGVAGADVAQLYLGDPTAAGEPPRQLVGFKRVHLRPGASAQLEFTITPRDTWWWDQNAGGWTQSPGSYDVYVGDSSATSDLPLQGSFAIAKTAAARQVIVHAPREFVPGAGSRVSVRLTGSGTATLASVRLALQLPQGWTALPVGPTRFSHVGPARTPHAAFIVTPPAWAPLTSATVHATAQLGPDATREAGVTSTLVASAS